MRLTMDARGVGRSGIGRHVHAVLDAVVRDPRFSLIHLLGEPSRLESYRNDRVRVTPDSSGFYDPRYQVDWIRRRRRGELDADVYFFPHYDAPFRLPRRSVVTVHDLIHFKLPDLFPFWKKIAAGTLLDRVVDQAAHVIVVSHTTRKDLAARIPASVGKTSVVPLGLDSTFLEGSEKSAPAGEFAESLGPFLLCVGNRKPHKNLRAAVEALALVRSSIPAMRLVIAGGRYPGWEDVVRVAAELGVSDALVEMERVSDETLRALYGSCSCLLFPSLYEGLGLPVLEAFAYGAPVVASNRSSLPELVDDAALLVEPTSPRQIADAVLRIEGEPQTRQRLIRRGRERCAEFDWQRAAAGVVDLLHAVGSADPDSLSNGWRQPIDMWPAPAGRPPSGATGLRALDDTPFGLERGRD